MRQRTALITGASGGIGLALARLLQHDGARVVSVGPRPAVEVAPTLRGDYCRVDLAQPFAAALVAEFLRRRGVTALDLPIHCAGVGSYGPAEAQAAAEIGALLNTNLRVALTGRGVHVLTVYPGPTRTAHARRYSPDNRREGRRLPPPGPAAAARLAARPLPGRGLRAARGAGRMAGGRVPGPRAA